MNKLQHNFFSAKVNKISEFWLNLCGMTVWPTKVGMKLLLFYLPSVHMRLKGIIVILSVVLLICLSDRLVFTLPNKSRRHFKGK